MSGNELMNEVNEGVVLDTVGEVTSNKNVFGKVAIVGAVVAIGVAGVLYIKRRRNKKANSNETIVVEKIDTKKSEK